MTPAALRREREWCLSGPDLLCAPPAPLAAVWAGVRHAAGETLPAPHSRLGRRFEQHWAWALRRHPDWTVHAVDRQIRHARITLGAPDLLVSGPGGVWHIELAVKFYLCRQGLDGADPASWHGPGRNDRLDRKLHRLSTHQLPLLGHPAAQRWLSDSGFPTPTLRFGLFKGVLFSHWRKPTAGPGTSPPAGRWCHLRDLTAAVTRARVLSRQMWLGNTDNTPFLTGHALLSTVKQSIQDNSNTQLLTDTHRWFVMPDDW